MALCEMRAQGLIPASAPRKQEFGVFLSKNLDLWAAGGFFWVFIQLHMRTTSGLRVGVSCPSAALGAAPAGISPGILVNCPRLEKATEKFKYLFLALIFP